MGDKQTLDQLKTHYRIRFYQNREADLPEIQPGTNVLSAIKNYFNDSEGKESPGFSISSLADSATNINIPESIRKKQGSSVDPCTSKLNELQSTGEINETKMKVTSSSAVGEKLNTPPYFNKFDVNVISDEEMDHSDFGIPVNLSVERKKETETVSRHRIYSSDSSVVQRPPSPNYKFSPKNRLYFSDAVVKDRESFASAFSNRFKKRSAEHVKKMQKNESVNYANNKTDQIPNDTAAGCVDEDNEEFVIEEEQGINMTFSYINKKSSGSSKETRSTTSSNTYKSQKLSFKSMAVSDQSVPHCKTFQQTRQTNEKLQMAEEDEVELNWDTNYENIRIPRIPKSKAERSKSSSVSHQMLEVEPAATVSSQPAVRFQKIINSLRDEKSNKVKDTVCLYKKNFASPLFTTANIEPPSKRVDSTELSDLPVVDEDEEFEINEIPDPDDCKKKTHLNPVDSKKDKKNEKNVPPEVHNASYTGPRKNDKNVKDSRKSHNDATDTYSPLKDKAEEKSKKYRSEVDRLFLPKPFQNDIDDITTSSRPRKISGPPSALLTAIPTGRNSAFEMEEPLPKHSPKSKNKTEEKSKKYRSEVDRLFLPKPFQNEIDDITTSSRPRKISGPPSALLTVIHAGRNSAFEMEEPLPKHSPKSKRKASAESKDPSEWQNDTEESFELRERPLNQDEETSLKENNKKSSKTLNSRKRLEKRKQIESEAEARPPKESSEWQSDKEESFEVKERWLNKDEEKSLNESDEKSLKNTRKIIKKLKPIESEEMAGPSKVNRCKNNDSHKKSQTSTKKLLRSPKHCKQLVHEQEKNDTESSHEHDLNMHDLPHGIDSLSVSSISASPLVSEASSSSQRHEPIFDKCSNKPTASRHGIQLEYLENCNSLEENIPLPHYSHPQQNTSPPYDSAKLTFQSGPVVKTRAMRYNKELDTVVRNFSSESPNIVNMSPMTIVLDPDTNSDALAECVHHSNGQQGRHPGSSRCFNNQVFSTGKVVLGPMEEEIRDIPQYDILVFYIIRGRILLKLHKSYHYLKSGDFFFIPPCNTYRIRNDDQEDVELIFTQLKSKSD